MFGKKAKKRRERKKATRLRRRAERKRRRAERKRQKAARAAAKGRTRRANRLNKRASKLEQKATKLETKANDLLPVASWPAELCKNGFVHDPGFEQAPVGRLIEPEFFWDPSGGWYSASPPTDKHEYSPDVGTAAQPIGWTNKPRSGDRYAGFWGTTTPGEAEGLGAVLKTPLTAGETYEVEVWATGEKSTRLFIYLSKQTAPMRVPDQNTYFLAASHDMPGGSGPHSWGRYTTTFTAPDDYTQVMLTAENIDPKAKSSALAFVAVDDFHISQASGCNSNLIPHPNFDKPETKDEPYGGWKSLFDNLDSKVGNPPIPVSEGYSMFSSPVDKAAKGDAWAVFRSYEGWYGKANSALYTKLAAPLVVGETYKVSFHGATRARLNLSPLTLKGTIRAQVNVGFTEAEPTKWEVRIPSTRIFDAFTLVGKTRNWHQYTREFVADKPYEYLIIQADRGDHPAIDGVCVTNCKGGPAGQRVAAPTTSEGRQPLQPSSTPRKPATVTSTAPRRARTPKRPTTRREPRQPQRPQAADPTPRVLPTRPRRQRGPSRRRPPN